MNRTLPGRRNPYRAPRPAVVSSSGGRTSAYMLRHIVDAHAGATISTLEHIVRLQGRE